MILIKLALFIGILVLSFYYVSTQDTKALSDQALHIKLILSFIAGVFYTSFLTSPFGVLLFAILGGTTNILLLTVVGGIGAVLGDLFILKIIRMIFRPFSFLRHIDLFKNFKKILRNYHMDLVAILLGMIIVASPLPDELGLALLGVSKLSYFKLAFLTFILNSAGIFVILYTARAIL